MAFSSEMAGIEDGDGPRRPFGPPLGRPAWSIGPPPPPRREPPPPWYGRRRTHLAFILPVFAAWFYMVGEFWPFWLASTSGLLFIYLSIMTIVHRQLIWALSIVALLMLARLVYVMPVIIDACAQSHWTFQQKPTFPVHLQMRLHDKDISSCLFGLLALNTVSGITCLVEHRGGPSSEERDPAASDPLVDSLERTAALLPAGVYTFRKHEDGPVCQAVDGPAPPLRLDGRPGCVTIAEGSAGASPALAVTWGNMFRMNRGEDSDPPFKGYETIFNEIMLFNAPRGDLVASIQFISLSRSELFMAESFLSFIYLEPEYNSFCSRDGIDQYNKMDIHELIEWSVARLQEARAPLGPQMSLGTRLEDRLA